METSVTQRGQTVIPAAIRRRYNIQSGDKLVWIDDGEAIKVIPVPADPVRALRGIARGAALQNPYGVILSHKIFGEPVRR